MFSLDIYSKNLNSKAYRYKLAKKGDIIAVLGKGNEEYQDIDGQHFFHSDKKIIMKMQ